MASTPFRSGAGDPLIARAQSIPRDDEIRDLPDDMIAASNTFFSPDDLQQHISAIDTDHMKNFWDAQGLVATGPFLDSPNGSLFDEEYDSGSASPRAPGKAVDTSNFELKANGHLDLMAALGKTEISPFALAGQSSTFLGAPENTGASDLFEFGGGRNEAVTDRPFVFGAAPDASAAAAFATPTNSPMNVESPRSEKSGQLQESSQPVMAIPRGQKRAAGPELSPNSVVSSRPSSEAEQDWPFFMPDFPQAGQPPIQEQVQQALQPEYMQQMPHSDNLVFSYTGEYGLHIQESTLKSRVETQMAVTMTLSHLPFGITKLHLPPHTISKPKLRAKPLPQPSPDTLELYVSLVCTTPMEQPELRKRALERAATVPHEYLPSLQEAEHETQNGCQIRICKKCIERERKRAGRKKNHTKSDEEKSWYMDETRRIIIFNTKEMKDWRPPSNEKEKDSEGPSQAELFRQYPTAMQVVVPMRLACYCRHQKEKTGFNVIFTFKDWEGNVVAQAMSGSIMITDDHKTVVTSPTDDAPELEQQGPAKKRKPSTPSPARVPQALTMTPLDASPNMTSQSGSTHVTSTVTSPFAPNLHSFPQPEAVLGAVTPQMSTTNGSPVLNPTTNDVPPWFAQRRSQSMDNLSMDSFVTNNSVMAGLYPTPVSSSSTRPPSPNSMRSGVNIVPHNPVAQASDADLYSLGVAANPPRAQPTIHKIIPAEGSLNGGMEVTVLGAGFYQGLEIWFGDNKATTTTFWSEASLVCLLPPSSVAGPVPVTFGPQRAAAPMGMQPPVFTYIDDNENQLMRAAMSFFGRRFIPPMNMNLNLPIYNAYIPNPPILRKVQDLMAAMPAMPGGRPDNASDDGTKADGRWWDLSSYMNTAAAPPAYNDIYPAKDADAKDMDSKAILSVARAAADAEADLKRSIRHDEPESSAAMFQYEDEAESSASGAMFQYDEDELVMRTRASARASSITIEPPAILEIGRKHAITKEQQENFLRAREQKLKKISNDRNLFFVWIPLLLVMICALLYSYFPSLFPFLWASIRAIIHTLFSSHS
ncbi:uncharacterized protein TRIVIDRAFT_227906 [Trichoderma virens Gv29-8]|uniref:IPT/TIG domain-containing protein n=1 Tax=Hypocrea virens (strain Gv29-8 / FGSC 10586) TaxID=413071 RepID=G9NAW0_HYPVG|nr:uncharacterized protein TRIVIDRAFT_227906 [Trichoderma virens Gv29-8]EHK15971.1 hypothetical protein TRIVIDRAFT_227906 [Trichoderma virens Gv29-8]UKZ56255.1 hypothetical protein TrVGV298_010088 [Trichoderma virens]